MLPGAVDLRQLLQLRRHLVDPARHLRPQDLRLVVLELLLLLIAGEEVRVGRVE